MEIAVTIMLNDGIVIFNNKIEDIIAKMNKK